MPPTEAALTIAALSLEMRQRVLHPVQDALEVYVEHFVEHRGVVLLDGVLLAFDPGVVVQASIRPKASTVCSTYDFT
ncbi:MAG: hypothetical protein JO363_23765 [Solirubrobacterales bacterium]|nr:hypothetical protein [Solirubrobacterales bacterium]